MEPTHRDLQRLVAGLSDADVRQRIGYMDPTDDEVSRARRRVATVHPVERKQIETNDYVFGTPMGRINDLAFELLAAEAVRHREPRPERFEVAGPSSG